MEVLEEAAKTHPTEWWWLKADGCDVVEGLKESVEHEWSGDVDLNDGKLAELHSKYMARRKFIEGVCIGNRKVLLSDLKKLKTNLKDDITFLCSSKLIKLSMYQNMH